MVSTLFHCFYSVTATLFRWPCSISIHLPGLSLLGSALGPLAMQHVYSCVSQACHCPRSVTGVSLSVGHEAFLFICFLGFYSFVFQVCHWWCPPLSVGHEAFLFICLPGLSLLVSALFLQRSISIHLSPRFTAGVRRFPSAMQHFYSLVSRSVTAGVRPFPLAM